MEKETKPLTKESLMKKVKLVYSAELAIFAVLFAVLGSLFLANVISVADWKRYAFSYVTLIGGTWLIIDFIWMLASPKRRAKNSFFDKIGVLPAALTVIGFDIYAFANGLVHIPEGAETSPLFRYFLGANMLYLALFYIASILYHWYRPLPSLGTAVDEALREEEAAQAEEAARAQEENKEPVEEPQSREENPQEPKE
ncbi:MAG: hypothetical protein IJU64_00700 [Bacilli bacterium]|nr:hypothetical protein [Bacilli bacterium]